MQKTKLTLAGLLFLFLCLFQGCYSFNGSSLPSHLKTVAVPVFDDRSGAGIAQYRGELTRGLADRIESQSPLRITPSMASADALIEGVIVSFSDSPSQLSSKTERAVTNRITIVVQVAMEDRVKKSKVFSQTFVGFADYPVGNFTAQREAIRFSLNQITDDIFDRVVSGW
ncbi:MAG: LptE family protein [Chlorobiaceae bacterium]|jgi:hypothetical protein|nr:LptE family protein [Chlorobiaceae bacterium]